MYLVYCFNLLKTVFVIKKKRRKETDIKTHMFTISFLVVVVWGGGGVLNIFCFTHSGHHSRNIIFGELSHPKIFIFVLYLCVCV